MDNRQRWEPFYDNGFWYFLGDQYERSPPYSSEEEADRMAMLYVETMNRADLGYDP